ncbi:MAG: hypothetical protein EOO65_06265 [Methanosarcinales archaeon]|nr:MAG: hypothetical protein EOO65_06265 [Methanosarcinales archaeon]
MAQTLDNVKPSAAGRRQGVARWWQPTRWQPRVRCRLHARVPQGVGAAACAVHTTAGLVDERTQRCVSHLS